MAVQEELRIVWSIGRRLPVSMKDSDVIDVDVDASGTLSNPVVGS